MRIGRCSAALLLIGLRHALSLSWNPARRSLLRRLVVGGAGGLLIQQQLQPANAVVDELPRFVRPLTNLGPLGKASTSSEEKTTGLSLTDLSERLTNDLLHGSHGQGGYFLTGDLSSDIFRNDCVFLDPTNQVASLSRYQAALRVLFDAERSVVELTEPLEVNDAARTISGTLRSRGFLQFPWQPYVTAYETKIVYRIDDDGLVFRQEQTWSKSAQQALQETFTPTLFTPPPRSTRVQPPDEPAAVTALFDKINGRRPPEYSQEERFEIARLIDGIANSQYEWNRGLLPGKWMTVYLQPGPSGEGIDRRIPFPEFAFNDNFQIFGTNTVQNVGALWGPLLTVRVSGTLREADETVTTTPKRFVANIDEGKLCWGKEANEDDSSCLRLPISGEGLFDGVYVGERLRIGQNINGGGARVVQVRL